MRGSGARRAAAEALPSKGAQRDNDVKKPVNVRLATGRTRFELRGDQERSIAALKSDAAKVLREQRRVQAGFEESPVGDSESNRLAEGAVRDVKGLVRMLRHAAEELRGVVIGPTHLSLQCIDANGRTPCELVKGRPFRKALLAFGERLFYSPTGERASGLTDRWLEGIFLGLVDRSDEIYPGATAGVMWARSFKRMPMASQSGKVLFGQLKRVPWDPVPGALAEEGQAPPAGVEVRGGRGGSGCWSSARAMT